MLNFCDFIQVYVFTTNHHLKHVIKASNQNKLKCFNRTFANTLNLFFLILGSWGA